MSASQFAYTVQSSKIYFLIIHKFEFLSSRFLAKPAENAKNKLKFEHYLFFHPSSFKKILFVIRFVQVADGNPALHRSVSEFIVT